MKYSPTPWTIRRAPRYRAEHGETYPQIVDADGSLVLNGCDYAKGREEANTALMAAAPALLQQLRAFVDFANEWFGEGKMPEDWKGRCVCANVAIDSALEEGP